MRAVIDTGVFVSALIRKQGTTGDVLRALRDGRFTAIYTTDIVVEIIDVLGRAKFRMKYNIEPDDITILVNLIRLRGELVTPTQKITACRDPKDDKFLEPSNNYFNLTRFSYSPLQNHSPPPPTPPRPGTDNEPSTPPTTPAGPPHPKHPAPGPGRRTAKTLRSAWSSFVLRMRAKFQGHFPQNWSTAKNSSRPWTNSAASLTALGGG